MWYSNKMWSYLPFWKNHAPTGQQQRLHSVKNADQSSSNITCKNMLELIIKCKKYQQSEHYSSHQISIYGGEPAPAQLPAVRWAPWVRWKSSDPLKLENWQQNRWALKYFCTLWGVSSVVIIIKKKTPYVIAHLWWVGSGWEGCSSYWRDSPAHSWTPSKCCPTNRAKYCIYTHRFQEHELNTARR